MLRWRQRQKGLSKAKHSTVDVVPRCLAEEGERSKAGHGIGCPACPVRVKAPEISQHHVTSHLCSAYRTFPLIIIKLRSGLRSLKLIKGRLMQNILLGTAVRWFRRLTRTCPPKRRDFSLAHQVDDRDSRSNVVQIGIVFIVVSQPGSAAVKQHSLERICENFILAPLS